MRAALALLLAGVGVSAIAAQPRPRDPAVDRALAAFLSAPDRGEASRRAEAVVASGVSFEDALARIRTGRDYSADVPRGLQIRRHRTSNGRLHEYGFVIPESYDPSRPYQVQVQLHGGVLRTRPASIERSGTDRVGSEVDEILVYPLGWAASPWWSGSQVDNIDRILDRLKRTYNVDENRVYLTGPSDGGTGTYYVAFMHTTPWASFLPLIGDMTVLASPRVRVDGSIFPGNAVNKPFFIVNTGRDARYPAHVVQLYVDHLRTLGTELVFRVYPEFEHTIRWWPQERAVFEAFVHEHAREPLPDRLTWETDDVERFNRAHWLIIDRLGTVDGESRLPDSNILHRGVEYDFGLRINWSADAGRRVLEVVSQSNADRIGLREGDRIVEIDGAAIASGRDIADAMQRFEFGAGVRFVVERRGGRAVLDGVYQPSEVQVPPAPIFPRSGPSGRVDLTRRGNVIEASTQGVRAFTLLLSPSRFNFAEPVTVVANGRTVFAGRVEPNVATLLKWAAEDTDRTMVFGAELRIDLTSPAQSGAVAPGTSQPHEPGRVGS